MLRYADFRLDASSLQKLPDGTLKVVGQLTHPGIFSYRNHDGTERREYRPADEVFRKESMSTFAAATITRNHPVNPDGSRLVTPDTWKRVTIGHVGENVREDGGRMVADLYIKDAAAAKEVLDGKMKHISCGYDVDYDATPGETPGGERYDGIQRNIRGNHVALLPAGIAPRGGSECVLRLDSAGDEISPELKSDVDLETLKAQVAKLTADLAQANSRADAAEAQNTVLTGELAKARTDATEPTPERLDALVDARAEVVALAKANDIDPKGKSALQVKRAVIVKRTPKLADRIDSMNDAACDACLAVYQTEPHPSMQVLGDNAGTAGTGGATRADGADANAIPKIADLHAKHVQNSLNAWKNKGDMPGVN